MLQDIALATLAEAKRELKIGADASTDVLIEDILARVSAMMEEETDCRLMYRPTVESPTAITAAAAWASGAVAFSQPSGPRSLDVTFTTASGGVLNVVGVGPSGNVVALRFDAALGKRFRSARAITTITSVTGTAAQGGGTVSIGTALPYAEYHNFMERRGHFYTKTRPIIDIVALYEDPARLFGPTTTLTYGTHYVLMGPDGRIQRATQSGAGGTFIDFPEDAMFRFPGQFSAWSLTPQVTKVEYTAGYEPDPLRASVPLGLKDICLQATAVLYHQIDLKLQGMTSRSEGSLGSTSRFARDPMYQELRDRLRQYRTLSTTAQVIQ